MIFNKPKTFINQVQALNKGEPVESELIWRAFEGEKAEENVAYFCLQLILKVLESSKRDYIVKNEERIYATLLCLELYKNRKPKSPEECKNLVEGKGSTHEKGFMQFLFRTYKDDGLVEFFVSRLTMVPKDIDLSLNVPEQIEREFKESEKYLQEIYQRQDHKNYEILKRMSYPKYKVIETRLLSFGYMCFVDHVRNNRCVVKLAEYEYMKDVLKILISGIQNFDPIVEVLPLMTHLIHKCITFYGCFYEGILKEIIVWANQLRIFPNPLCNIGSDLFWLLYEELKIPGNAFRHKLRKDFPSLDMKESVFLNREFYIISDTKNTIFNCHEDRSLSTLRKLIVLHTAKIAKVEESTIEKFRMFLKTRNHEASYILYDQCVKIMETLSKLDIVKSIKESLKLYVTKLIKESQIKYQESVIKSDSLEAEEFDILSKKMNEFGIFEYPKFSIVSVSIQDFCSGKEMKEGSYNLMKIIQKNKSDYQGKGFFKNKIPLIFYDDGFQLSKLIKPIVDYQIEASLEEVKQFQIYFIPKMDSTFRTGLSSYISYKDGWYRRFVNNIFKEKALYPSLEINEKNKDLFPFYIYKKNLELFIREANQSFPLRVYKCELTMSDFSSEPESFYMASNFTMGLFCEAEIIKMNKERDEGKKDKYFNKEIIEVIEDKVKKIPCMTLSLEIEYVESFTNEVKFKKEDKMKVEDLQICNLPHEYFLGREPNPSSPNLEMTILTSANGKNLRREILNSDNFKESRDKSEVHKSFQDLFYCHTIRSITIDNLDKGFPLELMIDGSVANRVDKIKIYPAVSKSGCPISIPIQCFLQF